MSGYHSNPSTTLYTLGRGIMSIGEWAAESPPGSYDDVGNCPRMEVEVTEETLEHFSSRSGTRVKDKEVTLETGYTLNFDLDEMSVANLAKFLRGNVSGAKSHIILANQNLNSEHAIKFISDNATGPNEKWEFHKCKLTPGGAFSLIGDEWSLLSFTGEGLADVANNPTSEYFTVTYATTTTP